MSEAVVKVVVGLRGYGKTTKVLQLTAGSPRVLYYDTLGDDYSDGVICSDRATLEKFWLGVYRKRFRIVYRPQDPVGDIGRICELAYACGDMTLVVDECQLFFRGQWTDPAFTKLITAGRHAGVELIAVTQAPKKLGELLRSQAREWYIFGTREPDHVKYIADRCVGVDAAHILALQKFDYLHYLDGADCYWKGNTGTDHEEPVSYESETPAPGPVADPGGHPDAG